MKLHSLISAVMLQQNAALHQAPEGFGGSGWRHGATVIAFAKELGAKEVLDYGCGECTLRRELGHQGSRLRVREYDPAIPKYARLPHPADLVVCTDVLEHVEPDKLETVMNHLALLTHKGLYLAIATRKANKLLPDGRNAHLIIEDTPWWEERVRKLPLTIVRMEDKRRGDGTGHSCKFWLRSSHAA